LNCDKIIHIKYVDNECTHVPWNWLPLAAQNAVCNIPEQKEPNQCLMSYFILYFLTLNISCNLFTITPCQKATLYLIAKQTICPPVCSIYIDSHQYMSALHYHCTFH